MAIFQIENGHFLKWKWPFFWREHAFILIEMTIILREKGIISGEVGIKTCEQGIISCGLGIIFLREGHHADLSDIAVDYKWL